MCLISYCICSRSFLSSAPSGSSISTRSGSKTKARATATRCCCPPESCAGRRFSKPDSSTMARGPGDLFLDLRGSHFPHLQRKGEVLPNAHMRKQGVILEHHADAALVRGQGVDGLASEKDFAMGDGLKTGQHQQAGGLAGSRRSEHGQEFAFFDIEIEVFDDQRLAVIALFDIAEANQGVRAAASGISHQRNASQPLQAIAIPDIRTVRC